MEKNVYAILMAGGVGSRFWPRSRKKLPKQALNIFGKDTMVQVSLRRLTALVDISQILVITNTSQERIIKEQLPQLQEDNFISEPAGRNTAPCIGLAAIHLAEKDPDAIMVVLPADHYITKVDEFQKVIRFAVEFAAENNNLITLGITPKEPVTGYGYIQAGEEVLKTKGHSVHKVRTFAEKPNLATAERFIKSGDFYWNSGIFIWKVSAILKELRHKLPEIYQNLKEVQKEINKPGYQTALKNMYRNIGNVSIDYGVMQQAENVYVIPADMGWNDVGSWETVYEISPKDQNSNTGEYLNLIDIDSPNNYIYSPHKVVALVGVEKLIVVDVGDALLICQKSSAQDVKKVVEYLRKKGLNEWL